MKAYVSEEAKASVDVDGLKGRLSQLQESMARFVAELAEIASELLEDAKRWGDRASAARGAFALDRVRRRHDIQSLMFRNKQEQKDIVNLLKGFRALVGITEAERLANDERSVRIQAEKKAKKKDAKKKNAAQRAADHASLILRKADFVKQKRHAFAMLVKGMADRPGVEVFWPEWSAAARALVDLCGDVPAPDFVMEFTRRFES